MGPSVFRRCCQRVRAQVAAQRGRAAATSPLRGADLYLLLGHARSEGSAGHRLRRIEQG